VETDSTKFSTTTVQYNRPCRNKVAAYLVAILQNQLGESAFVLARTVSNSENDNKIVNKGNSQEKIGEKQNIRSYYLFSKI
jgi:hypothetical protein